MTGFQAGICLTAIFGTIFILYLMVDYAWKHFRKTETTSMGHPPFGYSMHVDLYGVDHYHALNNIDFAYQTLEGLAATLHMATQAPPQVFRSPVPDNHEKAGLTGFLPLIESGITIHTLMNRRFVSIDIYTCGALDEQTVIEYLSARYNPDDWDYETLDRGKRYAEWEFELAEEPPAAALHGLKPKLQLFC